MRIILDTNVLLVSIPTRSKYRPIFNSLLNGGFELAISNDILSEYIEIIEQKTNTTIAKNIAELQLNLDNVLKVDVYFKWNLIQTDYDDNKFVDCAIAGKADYIVTNDKHFKVLKDIDFPPVKIISINKLLTKLSERA